jgi:hypothetical protein
MLNQHDARRADDIYLTVEFITMPLLRRGSFLGGVIGVEGRQTATDR